MGRGMACKIDDHLVPWLVSQQTMCPEMRGPIANKKKVLEYFLEFLFFDPVSILFMFNLKNVFILNSALDLDDFKEFLAPLAVT